MICVAINHLAYGCLSQFSIENSLSYGLEHENALQLFQYFTHPPIVRSDSLDSDGFFVVFCAFLTEK